MHHVPAWGNRDPMWPSGVARWQMSYSPIDREAAVSAVAAVISYRHAYELVSTHGQA